MVYLTVPEDYRYVTYRGDAQIREGVLVLPERCSLETGDVIDVSYGGKDATFTIVGDEDGYYLGDDTIDYEGEISFEKRMCEELECDSPYDMMYVDFIIGKICYYQEIMKIIISICHSIILKYQCISDGARNARHTAICRTCADTGVRRRQYVSADYKFRKHEKIDIDAFAGLNLTDTISNEEFSDMKNIAPSYPYIASRRTICYRLLRRRGKENNIHGTERQRMELYGDRRSRGQNKVLLQKQAY